MVKAISCERYDVIVVGAGPAGISAAIQVSRAGAHCLLVEKSGLLGGTTVTAGVNFPGLFHAWGRQIIAGIGWELVELAVRESGGQLPDFRHDNRPHFQRQVLVDRFTYAASTDAMVSEAGVQILLHSLPVSAQREGDHWKVVLAGKEGLSHALSHVLIDTSGDANLVSLAGGKIRRNDTLQPGTLMFHASGYDTENLDYDAVTHATREAIRTGKLLPSDIGGCAEKVRVLLRQHGENILHVPNIDARTSAGKSAAELAGRAALLRVQRFLRQQPGLKNFRVDYFAAECGIRETVTIDGEVEVTAQDYVNGRYWPDAVCYSFYPIDVHEDSPRGIDTRPLEHGIYPTLPLRCMLPKDTTNLLAAGRITCGDKEANSAFRVQASCMAMGQAVGAVATLAVQMRTEVRRVPLEKIYCLLAQHGAIVPGHVTEVQDANEPHTDCLDEVDVLAEPVEI